MSRLNAIALCAAAAALSLAAASCIKEKDSLVIVSMTADMEIPGPIQVRVSVGPVTQTFDLATGLSVATPTQRGIYLDSKTTGTQVVSAGTQGGAPCLTYAAVPQQTVAIGSAGETKMVLLVLVHAGACGSNSDAGGGAGGTVTDAGGDRSGTGGSPGTGGRPPGTGGTAGTGAGGNGVGGAGGAPVVVPPSLSRCTEIHHTDVTPCDTSQGIGFGTGNPEVFSVVFSPDGKLLLTAGDDGRIRFWNVGTGAAAPTIDGRELSVNSQGYLAFSHNGQYLAAGDAGGRVTVWTLSNTPTIYAILNGHTDAVAQVSFSPDDTHLVSAGADMQVFVWSMASKASVATIPLIDGPWTIEVSPLATATALPVAVTQFDGNLVLMNALATPPTKLTTLISFDTTWFAEGLAYSPDGKTLAIGSEDGSLSLWTGISTNQPVRTTPFFLPQNTAGSWQAVKGVAFFPDSQHVAAATGTSGNGGQLAIFETGTKRQIASKIPTYYPVSVATSPDGAGIVAGEVECGLVLYCHD